MLIIGIDPGPKESGYIEYDTELNDIYVPGVRPNEEIESVLQLRYAKTTLAIEMVASYGMAVGESVFRTCVQIGRFEKCCSMPFAEVYRSDVKLTLCGNKRAKQTNIVHCLTDMFGGKDKAIGGNKCKKCKGKGWSGRNREVCSQCRGTGWLNPPGPLAGVKSHAWSALAVALTYAILNGHLSPLVANPGGLCRSSRPSARGCLEDNSRACSTPLDNDS